MDENNSASEETKNQQLSDTELQEIIKDAEELAEAKLKLDIEKVRALPAQRVLSPRQHETLLSIKQEDLTDADKTRIAWAALRFPKQKYSGTDYTPAEQKKIKAKRKAVKKSRRANRVK